MKIAQKLHFQEAIQKKSLKRVFQAYIFLVSATLEGKAKGNGVEFGTPVFRKKRTHIIVDEDIYFTETKQESGAIPQSINIEIVSFPQLALVPGPAPNKFLIGIDACANICTCAYS